jgi:hypothetical protein
MRDTKIAILEDQVDVLAGRIADVEEQCRKLLLLLTTDPVPKKPGLDARHIALRCEVIKGGNGERWHHEQTRRSLLAKAEIDAFRRRIATTESLAELTNQSFPEAWEATREDHDDECNAAAGPATTSPHDTVWEQALAHLATVVNRYSFLTWFQDSSLVRDEGGTLVVQTSDRLAASWLTTHYGEVVAAALSAIGRADTRVTFVGAEGEAP